MVNILSLWCHLIRYTHANCGCEMINGLKCDFCFSSASCFLSKFHLHQSSESVLIVEMPVWKFPCPLARMRKFKLTPFLSSFYVASFNDLRNKWIASKSNHIETIWIKKKSNKFTYIVISEIRNRMKNRNKSNKQYRPTHHSTTPSKYRKQIEER